MFQKIGILIAVIGVIITATRYYGQFRAWQEAREKLRRQELARAARRAAKRAVHEESRVQASSKRANSADDLQACPRCGSFVPSGVCDCNS